MWPSDVPIERKVSKNSPEHVFRSELGFASDNLLDYNYPVDYDLVVVQAMA